jgi:hypothetical protein
MSALSVTDDDLRYRHSNCSCAMPQKIRDEFTYNSNKQIVLFERLVSVSANVSP